MLLFSQASVGWILLVAAAFIGFGYGNFNSIAQTGPFILGFIEPHTTYCMIFTMMIPIIIICIPLYRVLVGRKQKAL